MADHRELWRASHPVTPDDEAGRYLASIGIDLSQVSADVRTLDATADSEASMLVVVRKPDGDGATLHQTWIRLGEAVEREFVQRPPAGWYMAPCVDDDWRGVAESVEDALAVKVLRGLACRVVDFVGWRGAKDAIGLAIYGTASDDFSGEARAYTLAARLESAAFVDFPTTESTWARELARLHNYLRKAV